MSGELFHFTCDHGREGIARDGVLRPNRHPYLPEPLVWLTDLWTPMRHGLGLTSYSLSCDRTEYRFDVESARSAEHWPRYARRLGLSRAVRDELEGLPGVQPMHWWVATAPVLVMSRTPVTTRSAFGGVS